MEENSQNNMEQNTAQNIDQVNNNETQVTNVDPVVEQNVQPEPVIDTTNQVQENVQNNIEEPKKKSKLPIIILIIVLLALIGVGGYFAYNKFFANKEETTLAEKENKTEEPIPEKEENEPVEPEEETNDEEEPESDYTIYDGKYIADNKGLYANYVYSSTIKINNVSNKNIANAPSVVLEEVGYCESKTCSDEDKKYGKLNIKVSNGDIKLTIGKNSKIFDINNAKAVNAYYFMEDTVVMVYLTNDGELYNVIFDNNLSNVFEDDYKLNNSVLLAKDVIKFEIINGGIASFRDAYSIIYEDKTNNKKISNINCDSSLKCKFEFNNDNDILNRIQFNETIYYGLANNALYIVNNKNNKTLNYIKDKDGNILDVKKLFIEEEMIEEDGEVWPGEMIYYLLSNNNYLYKLDYNKIGINVSLVNNTKVKNYHDVEEKVENAEDDEDTIDEYETYTLIEFEDGKQMKIYPVE